LQDLVWRIAYHDGAVCTSHKRDDRASMPNVIAEQRDRIVEIGVYGLAVSSVHFTHVAIIDWFPKLAVYVGCG
jgi:hypothetical protein